MAKAPIMPLFTDALIGDTTHLSAEQFGAYVLILIATWRNNGQALPDDDERMARVCRVGVRHWRQKLRPILLEFFALADGHWHQQRLETEWARVSKLISKRQANGQAGGRAKRQQTLPFERSKSEAIHNHKEASLPNQDSESTSNIESLNAAREDRKKGETEKKQTGNPEGGRCAPLADASAVQSPHEPAKRRTPVGVSRPAFWECNDELPSLASATDYPDLHRQDQGQDSLAERVASRSAALPRAHAAPRKSPALKAKIRAQLQQKHARYLQARRRPDELAAYWAAMLDDDPAVAQRAFDDTDRRMRAARWDDMRAWKLQQGIMA